MDDYLQQDDRQLGWLRKVGRFLYLLFYRLPFKEERDKSRYNGNLAQIPTMVILLSVFVYEFVSLRAYDFPKESQLQHIQGIAKRDIHHRIGKFGSDKLIITSEGKDITTICGANGHSCIKNWSAIEGQLVDVYIDGGAHVLALKHKNKTLVSYSKQNFSVLLKMKSYLIVFIFFFIFFMARLIRIYSKQAYRRVFTFYLI